LFYDSSLTSTMEEIPMSRLTSVLSSAVSSREEGGARTPVAAPLCLLVTCGLLVLMQLYVAIPLASPISREMGGHNAFAALATAYSLAYAAGFLVFGPLSDHYGRKTILVPGLLTLAASTACLSLVHSWEVLAVLRALQGFSAASFPPVALAYLSEALPARWRTTAIGAMSTAFLAAGIAGQIYASAVASTWGWRWVFALAAVAFALAAVAVVTILREPFHTAPRSTLGQRFGQFRMLVRRRELTLPVVAAFTVLLAFVAMYTALGPELQVHFGLDQTGILLVRLTGLPAMLLAPVAGALANRIGTLKVLVTGFTLATLGLTLEALANGSLGALIAASVIFVAGIATTVPAHIALVSECTREERARGIALYSFVLFVGASVGPLTTQLPLGFKGLLLALAALLVSGAVLVILSSVGRRREARIPRLYVS
jgi:YNFM family putative membrane transporter